MSTSCKCIHRPSNEVLSSRHIHFASVHNDLSFVPPNGELTDFLPWQWAPDARLTGQKVRSNDWFAPQSGAGQSGGLTQAGNSRVRTAKRCEPLINLPICPDNVIIAGFSGSFARCRYQRSRAIIMGVLYA